MKKIKVLLVDDSESDYELLNHLFIKCSSESYQLEWEPNPDKAQQLMIQNSHDAYLVDYNLGVTQGTELIQSVKPQGCSKPIIVITGSGASEADSEALKVGADDYIIKNELSYHYLDKTIRYSIERNENEKRNIEQQMKFTHALRMSELGGLASGIAHEINNPLAVACGLLESISKRVERGKLKTEELPELLDKILKMNRRIGSIVKGLQSVSRKSDKDPFSLQSLDCIIEEALSICLGKLKLHNVTLKKAQINPTLKIQCRPGEIIQVIVNLVNNAIDAISKQPDPWIEIDTVISYEKCFLQITDSGNGISKELKEKILLPYFSTKDPGKGTGLGLSISKMIIESHAGELYIDDKCDHTRFVIKIPVQQVQETKLSVLIVEDDVNLREILADILESEGTEVEQTGTGEEAIEKISNHFYDIIISDINMPGISGLVLSEEIYQIYKDKTKKPRLIFVTGYNSVSIPKNVKEMFGSELLPKPIDEEKIVSLCFGVENKKMVG